VLTVVTGPVRAGKSSYALRLARDSGKAAVYVATALIDAGDPEMTARVARHRAERGELRTVEVDERRGPGLAAALAALGPHEIAVVDSLGTWLGGLLLGEEERAEREPLAVAEMLAGWAEKFHATVAAMEADAVIVAEEAGWGLVPPSPLGRIFRDELGRTTAALARTATRVYLVVAGYAVDLRTVGEPIGGGGCG
jgi:adenosylcobinamide kinase/adenosylcobinamide-phosphate guanylyltransferase